MAAEYSQGSNYVSSSKMSYFHYFLKQLTGYTIHPSIGVNTTGPMRVADLGTHTGIWALDVAEDPSFTDIEVDAFDLQDEFFPPPAWTPKNVRWHIHDVYEPFAQKLLAQFDVVHVRLFLSMSETQIRMLICNAMTLLKPGGHLQWVEHDKASSVATTAIPGQPNEAAQAYVNLQKMPFPNYNFQWVSSIGDVMKENGLDVVTAERTAVRPSMLRQVNDLHLLSMMDARPGLSDAIDSFRAKYMDGSIDEFRKGVAIVDGFICIVGKKAYHD